MREGQQEIANEIVASAIDPPEPVERPAGEIEAAEHDMPPTILEQARTAFRLEILKHLHGQLWSSRNTGGKTFIESEIFSRQLETMEALLKLEQDVQGNRKKPEIIAAAINANEELTGETKRTLLKLAETYQQAVRDADAFVRAKPAAEIFTKLTGSPPINIIHASRFMNGLSWKFESRQDQEAFYAVCQLRSPGVSLEDAHREAKKVDGVLTHITIDGRSWPMVIYRNYLRDSIDRESFHSDMRAEEVSAHEQQHAHFNFVFEPEWGSETSTPESFASRQEYWKKAQAELAEQFKDELLAIYVGQSAMPGDYHLPFDFSPVADFRQPGSIYDWAVRGKEQFRKVYQKVFPDSQDFETEHEKFKADWYAWSLATARQLAHLFNSTGEDPIADDWKNWNQSSALHEPDEKRGPRPLAKVSGNISNDAQAGQEQDIISLLSLYPAAQWPSLVPRLERLATEYRDYHIDNHWKYSEESSDNDYSLPHPRLLAKIKNWRVGLERSYLAPRERDEVDQHHNWRGLVKSTLAKSSSIFTETERQRIQELAKVLADNEQHLKRELPNFALQSSVLELYRPARQDVEAEEELADDSGLEFMSNAYAARQMIEMDQLIIAELEQNYGDMVREYCDQRHELLQFVKRAA